MLFNRKLLVIELTFAFFPFWQMVLAASLPSETLSIPDNGSIAHFDSYCTSTNFQSGAIVSPIKDHSNGISIYMQGLPVAINATPPPPG